MDKKTDAWMPLWIGSYLADTQRLTRDQHGGYLLLLMAYWREGGPLVDDDEELASIVKATPKEWSALRPRLAKFFAVADGYWSHKRVEKELAGAKERSEKSSSKARAAAEARWNRSASIAPCNASSNAPSITQALQEQCPTPSPTPINTSVPNGTGGQAAKLTDPAEIIFGYGLSMLTNAGTIEKQARSFLGGLRKMHGDEALIDKLRDCAKAKPLQPLEWLAAALPPLSAAAKRAPKAENFAAKDYGNQIEDV